MSCCNRPLLRLCFRRAAPSVYIWSCSRQQNLAFLNGLCDIFTDWMLPQQLGLWNNSLCNTHIVNVHMNVCTHTDTPTRYTWWLYLFGRPFSCEAAVYSSQTTALPATSIIIVPAGLFVYGHVPIRMCVSCENEISSNKLHCEAEQFFPKKKKRNQNILLLSQLKNTALPFLSASFVQD